MFDFLFNKHVLNTVVFLILKYMVITTTKTFLENLFINNFSKPFFDLLN